MEPETSKAKLMSDKILKGANHPNESEHNSDEANTKYSPTCLGKDFCHSTKTLCAARPARTRDDASLNKIVRMALYMPLSNLKQMTVEIMLREGHDTTQDQADSSHSPPAHEKGS